MDVSSQQMCRPIFHVYQDEYNSDKRHQWLFVLKQKDIKSQSKFDDFQRKCVVTSEDPLLTSVVCFSRHMTLQLKSSDLRLNHVYLCAWKKCDSIKTD